MIMSSPWNERKTTWCWVNSTRNEALPNYWFRKAVRTFSLSFLDSSLRKFHQRDSSSEVFSTRDELRLVAEVRVFLRVVVYRLNKKIWLQNWLIENFLFWFDLFDSEYWLFWPPFNWALPYNVFLFSWFRTFCEPVHDNTFSWGRSLNETFHCEVLSAKNSSEFRWILVKVPRKSLLVKCSQRGTNLASSLKFGFSFVLSCTAETK